ncbi:UPF0175 family protein [Aequorivita todarodis]|uniref:UPF0175 family protein n=1 Tax=Aequorivita todarodis TaxID=2036821 RepID=UPI00234FED0F|nr:UPF0175 family protein [Aequorivita todarodis]MDC8000644.1 UPF0175 family protein [Aequorivita todarodis]
MKKIEINIPESVDEKKFKMEIAAFLFEKQVLSSGQAAKMIGISRREFLENVGKYGVSIFGETWEDLEKLMNG